MEKPIVSPLRQRMLDDMRMRKFGEKTQLDYVRAVRRFAQCDIPPPELRARIVATSRIAAVHGTNKPKVAGADPIAEEDA